MGPGVLQDRQEPGPRLVVAAPTVVLEGRQHLRQAEGRALDADDPVLIVQARVLHVLGAPLVDEASVAPPGSLHVSDHERVLLSSLRRFPHLLRVLAPRERIAHEKAHERPPRLRAPRRSLRSGGSRGRKGEVRVPQVTGQRRI